MKVAIVDDFREDREILKEYIARYAEDKSLVMDVECFGSGEKFIAKVQPQKYRIVFLDIYMGGMDGMQVAEHIRKDDKDTLIVFTTSTKEFAIRGYLVKAAGYLVKPYEYELFEKTMDMVQTFLKKDMRYIEVKVKRNTVKILLSEIIYCDYDNHYILFHTEDEVIRSYVRFKELEEMLKPHEEFLCCYRNIMVNLDKVQAMEAEYFIMENGEKIPIRRPDRTKVRKLYAEHAFRSLKGGSRFE